MFLFAGKSSQNSFSVIQLSHVFQNTEDTEFKEFFSYDVEASREG